ncbi:Pentatricopeptide repeat, partial [Dillenia turbinata]
MRWICGVVKSSQLPPIASTNPLGFRRIQSPILQFSSVFQLPIGNPNPRFSVSSDGLLTEVKIGTFHANAIKDGSAQILQMGNYLLDLYVKFQKLGEAHKLFDEFSERDVRAWTTLISGFARIGSSNMVFELFKMMQKQGVCPNEFTLSALLKCCSGLNEPRIGTEIHGRILRNGIDVDVALGNSLLDFYVKHKEFSYAERLFEMMGKRNTVSVNVIIGAYMQMGDMEKSLALFQKMSSKEAASWNTVIHGLIRNGHEKVAFELLYIMVDTGVAMDERTFSIAFMLASSLSDLKLGKEIHCKVIRAGNHNHEFIKTSIVDMYCKCGQMETASILFDTFSLDSGRRKSSMISCDEAMTDIILWSSLVSGYVKNARYEDALKVFPTMILKQVAVDMYTLTSLVSACTNAGNLELGQQIHAYIQKIGHKLDDFFASSLIDMYSKCGSLNDARVLFSQTPTRNNIQMANWISEILLKLEPLDADSYVLSSNVCAASQRWVESAKTRSLMQERGIGSVSGQSWIQLKDQIHTFVHQTLTYMNLKGLWAHHVQ